MKRMIGDREARIMIGDDGTNPIEHIKGHPQLRSDCQFVELTYVVLKEKEVGLLTNIIKTLNGKIEELKNDPKLARIVTCNEKEIGAIAEQINQDLKEKLKKAEDIIKICADRESCRHVYGCCGGCGSICEAEEYMDTKLPSPSDP